MGREIKFRAWDKKTKNMYLVKGISFAWKWASWDTGVLQSQYKGFDELELMQFTGLHDKNGREIWEGDIVKTINGEIGKVVFSIGAFWVEYVWPHNWDPMAPAELLNADMEVVGNIYENPELLGGENESKERGENNLSSEHP